MAPDDKADFEAFIALYEKHYDRVQHENNLIHNRTTWLITIQALIITTIGLVYAYYFQTMSAVLFPISPIIGRSVGDLIKIQMLNTVVWDILLAFSALAEVVSLASLVSIWTASVSIQSIEIGWLERNKPLYPNNSYSIALLNSLPNLTNGEYSSYIGDRVDIAAEIGAPLGLSVPFFFCCLWLYVIYTMYFYGRIEI